MKEKIPSISSWIKENVQDVNFYSPMLLQKLKEKVVLTVPKDRYGNWNYKTKRKRFNSFGYMKKSIGRTCRVCKYVGNLDRHHIIPFANGGVSIKENIIGLCRKCHSNVHGFRIG